PGDRGRDRRSHLHLPDQARRAARAVDRLPPARRVEGARMLKRALLLAFAVALVVPAKAHAVGIFSNQGTTLRYDNGGNEVDDIAIFPVGTSTIRITHFGGTGIGPAGNCAFVDSESVDCPANGITRIILDLGDGDDVASVSQAITIPTTLLGG